MNRKKIVMAEFNDVRFDARVLKEAKSLTKAGFKVMLFMYNTSISRNQQYTEEDIDFKIYSFKNKVKNLTILDNLFRLISGIYIILIINLKILVNKANIYHAHNLYFLFVSILASKIWRGKVIYDAHELHSEHHDNSSYKGFLLNTLNEYYEKILIRYCDIHIQASEERAEFIAKKYNKRKPLVINNYVPYFEPINKNFLRDKLNIPNKIPILFYSGGIYSSRGRRLDKVFESLRYFDNIKLCIIGFMNDSIKKEIDNILNKNNLASKVVILPPCPYSELIQYASSADIGIIPLYGNSINTQLSALNKVSEYFMAGLPIVCSNYQNLEKIVFHNPIGPVGKTFNVLYPKSIADAIHFVLQEKINVEYKRNALEIANKYFNWENEEKKLIDAYNNL